MIKRVHRCTVGWLVVAAVCAWLAACGAGTSGSRHASSVATLASIRAVTSVGPHVLDLGISWPAVGRAMLRLILPRDYDRRRSARWPVLYLLHGCCDSYLSWTRSTDVVRFFAARDVLVVMPDGGRVGFYSDWSRGPRWETFHLVELVRLLHQRYRASDVRAVAGVSMGGLGALDYAARHPGMFRAAASL
jgi:diacylglycerol O-acyltransferase / trehalose O-mycolyltransferase